MKTIQVKDDTWQKLTILKADLMARDLDGVVSYLIIAKQIKGDPTPVKH